MPNTMAVIVWDEGDAMDEVILGRLYCNKAENNTNCEVRIKTAKEDIRLPWM